MKPRQPHAQGHGPQKENNRRKRPKCRRAGMETREAFCTSWGIVRINGRITKASNLDIDHRVERQPQSNWPAKPIAVVPERKE